MTVHLSARMQ